MKFIGKNKIQNDKLLNELDKFVLRFTKILEKHAQYVIVSGYVAILLGRSRATEDIDVFIPELSEKSFYALYRNLKKAGYWCLNAEKKHEVYSYLADGLAVRFALKNTTIPNVEVKFTKKDLDKHAFDDVIEVITRGGNIIISSLERQIAFKRYCLKSDKDLEDAKHIEELFKEYINQKKIVGYKRQLLK